MEARPCVDFQAKIRGSSSPLKESCEILFRFFANSQQDVSDYFGLARVSPRHRLFLSFRLQNQLACFLQDLLVPGAHGGTDPIGTVSRRGRVSNTERLFSPNEPLSNAGVTLVPCHSARHGPFWFQVPYRASGSDHLPSRGGFYFIFFGCLARGPWRWPSAAQTLP